MLTKQARKRKRKERGQQPRYITSISIKAPLLPRIAQMKVLPFTELELEEIAVASSGKRGIRKKSIYLGLRKTRFILPFCKAC
jgi:hypothetical protein